MRIERTLIVALFSVLVLWGAFTGAFVWMFYTQY